MSLHYILANPVCFLGLNLSMQEFGVAQVEQSVTVVIGQVVEVIKLEHYCIGASTPRAMYSTEVVAEHMVEMTG